MVSYNSRNPEEWNKSVDRSDRLEDKWLPVVVVISLLAVPVLSIVLWVLK